MSTSTAGSFRGRRRARALFDGLSKILNGDTNEAGMRGVNLDAIRVMLDEATVYIMASDHMQAFTMLAMAADINNPREFHVALNSTDKTMTVRFS